MPIVHIAIDIHLPSICLEALFTCILFLKRLVYKGTVIVQRTVQIHNSGSKFMSTRQSNVRILFVVPTGQDTCKVPTDLFEGLHLTITEQGDIEPTIQKRQIECWPGESPFDYYFIAASCNFMFNLIRAHIMKLTGRNEVTFSISLPEDGWLCPREGIRYQIENVITVH